MGTGDWNDGMNRVGEKGAGESVWLGWFLHVAPMAFIPLAEARQETVRAARSARPNRSATRIFGRIHSGRHCGSTAKSDTTER